MSVKGMKLTGQVAPSLQREEQGWRHFGLQLIPGVTRLTERPWWSNRCSDAKEEPAPTMRRLYLTGCLGVLVLALTAGGASIWATDCR
jgi:hypothetical protein